MGWEERTQSDSLSSLVPQTRSITSPNDVNCLASSISVAPAPGTKRLSLVRDLNVLMPSSTARSTSSIMLSVEPLTTTVEIWLPSWSVWSGYVCMCKVCIIISAEICDNALERHIRFLFFESSTTLQFHWCECECGQLHNSDTIRNIITDCTEHPKFQSRTTTKSHITA